MSENESTTSQDAKERLLKLHTSKPNKSPIHEVIMKYNPLVFSTPPPSDQILTKIQLDNYKSSEFYSKFDSTNRFFLIKKVVEVVNPYLYGLYLLRKEEYQKIYNSAEERILFHGTRSGNVDSIMMNNFDWRRHGQARGCIFGQGVSFSPQSFYASHYCGGDRMMFAATVLVSECCIGQPGMIIPPKRLSNGLDDARRYDTSMKCNGDVLVKYNDDEFYPNYLIHY